MLFALCFLMKAGDGSMPHTRGAQHGAQRGDVTQMAHSVVLWRRGPGAYRGARMGGAPVRAGRACGKGVREGRARG